MPDSETSRQTYPVVVFGEVLFDNFPDGRSVLGGAPFNVAWSLNGFGRAPLLVSAVGNDEHGLHIREKMSSWEMEDKALQLDAGHATGEVHVTIRDDEPSYEICEARAWDFIQDDGLAADGILYHGLLALRSPTSHATLQAIAARSSAQRFFDINLRPPHVDNEVLKFWLQNTDWLKLNIDELKTILDNPEITFENCSRFIDELRDEFSVGNVVLTGGASGAILQGDYGFAVLTPAPGPDPFVDTVGAGDAFSAATIEGILRGFPAAEIVETASRFAARVCGLRGATLNDRNFYKEIFHA